MMDYPVFQFNFEFFIICAVLFVVYLLPRFKYSQIQHIIRTPTFFRQGLMSFIVFLTLVIYHGYVFSTYPSWFFQCGINNCDVSFFEGLSFLLGYNHSSYEFTQFGQHSRLIFIAITLFTLGITFSFYIRYLNENRELRIQILHLKRKSEVILERYENPAYDSKDEFTTLHIDYDLPRMGLKELDDAICEYRRDHSLKNLNNVVLQMQQLKDI